jgi:hypothetical protein
METKAADDVRKKLKSMADPDFCEGKPRCGIGEAYIQATPLLRGLTLIRGNFIQ